MAQAGILLNKPDYNTYNYDSQSQVQGQLSGGYTFSHWLSAGGYLGLNLVSRVPLAPMGLDLRSELSNKRFSPTLYLQTGWGAPLRKNQQDNNWWTDSIAAKGGPSLAFGTGFRIRKSDGRESFWLSLGYLAQKSSLTFYSGETYRTTEIYNQNRWSIQMGWMFW